MNTDKTIDVEDLQEFLPDESSSLTYTAAAAAAAADAEDPIQNVASSRTQDRGDDNASVHEEVLSAVSFGGVSYNEKPFDFGGTDNEERSFDDVEGIIRQIHSDDTTTLTQSTSDRDFAERTLPEDTFSFLIYTNATSSCFLLGIMVFVFQNSIYAVLLYDIVDSGKKITKKNLFGFPFNVGPPVRIAEAIAILISIITQQDVRKAICLYRDGFDESGLTQVFQGATLRKWWLSIVFRAWEGVLGLIVTFLLIMRSDSVLDLLLNFSAIEFVTMLDDVLFELASEGFLGRPLKKETKRLSRKSYYVSHACANSKSARRISIAYFVVLCVGFFGGWGYIFYQQKKGKYLCQLIFSQFGDDKVTMLGTFTGLFSKHSKTFDGRSSYRRTGMKDGEKGPLLAYCEKETRWTLSLTKNGASKDKWNPCDDWLAASSKIESSESKFYDLLSTTSSPWIVNTPTNREAPLTHHFLLCYECKYDDSFCGDYGICLPAKKSVKDVVKSTPDYVWSPSEPDTADIDRCLCKPGRYGLRCEYFEPCQTLEISQLDKGFSKEGSAEFASRYYRLGRAKTYNRPVYTSVDDNNLTDGTDFILFTGERWIISYKDKFHGLKGVTDKRKLDNYFKNFHGNFAEDYKAVYESEPIYISDPLDAKITAYPLSLRWRKAGSQKEFDETDLRRFYCTTCDNRSNSNPCHNEGVCLTNGTCNCTHDYSGPRCEIPSKSLSNGHCDLEFNTKEFNFDEGDCCEETCRSTPENICGKLEGGYIDIGYPSCVHTLNQWNMSGDVINGVSSASRSGYVVALGGRGTILAVAEPGASIVRLFDKDGADWKQRRQSIQGPLDSHFGSAISLSSIESNTITHNPRTSPKVILAVGAPKIGLVRVFTCSTYECVQRGKDIVEDDGFGNSLSVDGDSIAIGGAARETISNLTTTNGGVEVRYWSNEMWEKRGSVIIASPLSRKLSGSPDQFRLEGYYVSLSGDYLAVGTLEGKFSPGPRFESVSLITQVFLWNKFNGVWDQLGDGIEKDFYDDASFGTPWPLKAVVIKGSILAIGNHSSANVYSWNDTSKNWTRRELELAKDTGSFVGWSVDLSEDASILAVGTNVENPQPTDESIRMYKWDSKSYKVQSNGIPGGPAASVSLSSDGKAVAVGLPFDSSNGGSTRVYNFYQASACDDPSEKSLRISFTTYGRPEETTWELRVDSEVRRSSGSLSGHAYTTFVEETCVPIESCVRFLVCGSQGDGLKSPGVFALMIDGAEVVRDSNFGGFKSYNVTNCVARATLPPSICPSISQPPTPSPTVSQPPSPSQIVTQPPTPRPTVTQTPTPSPNVTQPPTPRQSVTQPPTPKPTVTQPPTPRPNVTQPPTLKPTVTEPPTPRPNVTQPPTPRPNVTQCPLKICEDGSDLVWINVTLGKQPSDSYWDLIDQRDKKKIIVDVRYDVKEQSIVREVCKPRDDCYIFRLSTTGASAFVCLNGKEIKPIPLEWEINIGDCHNNTAV